MKFALTVLLLLNTLLPAHAGEPSEEREQAAAACRILDAWHADQPEHGQRHLHMVCWTPADREMPANYQARLTRIMRHIQDFYAGEMQRLGFGNRTIGLQLDDKQQLILHLVRGLHNTDRYFDPDGGSDYDATTASAVPDASGRFTLRSDALTAGKQGELRLFPLHVNGSAAGQMSQTSFRYSY